MITVHTIPVTVFGQNARVIACANTRDAVIVDPGGDTDKILEVLEVKKLRCVAVWLTHSHLDHCAGVAELLNRLKVPLIGHRAEQQMRASVSVVASMYGLSPSEWPNCPEPTHYVEGGEILEVGSARARVLFTPGHSPGHVSFYFESDALVVSGDTLFAGSIGRTDLPGGDHEQLCDSIRRELFSLPDTTRVLSGHGPDTTVGRERLENPFVGESLGS